MTTPEHEQPANPEPEKEADVDTAAPGDTGDAAPAVEGDSADISLAGEAINLLSEHKGKLAIGVAATLGIMVYYGWREKRLAKTDPEEYARLQRLKASVRHSDDQPKPRHSRKATPAPQPEPPAAAAPVQPDASTDTKTDIS